MGARFLFSSGNLWNQLSLKEPAQTSHYLANQILFCLARCADWHSPPRILGQSRLLEGGEESEGECA